MTEQEIQQRVEATRASIAAYNREQEHFSISTPVAQKPAISIHTPSNPLASAATVSTTNINRPLLWGLWLVTGLVGGHRYYLGNIGLGILQTITACGFGIWWVIDAVLMHQRVEALEAGWEPRVKF